MGSKTMQVKGAGSQSVPTPMNIAPQRGSEGIFHRVRNFLLGSVSGSYIEKKPYLSQKKEVQSGVTAGVTQYGGIRKL